MFRSRVQAACRASGTQSKLSSLRISNSSLRTRYASSIASGNLTRSKSMPLLALGICGSSALVAAYFIWPDVSRSAPTLSDAILSPSHFTPVMVVATEPCPDPNTRLITLAVPRQSLPSTEELSRPPIWSIFIKDDDIQVERPYTPLEGIDEQGRMKFWIKQYPKGEVGRWLNAKQVGDTIEIRGPLTTWPWQDGVWDEVVMISGGTGITPFYQLLHRTLLSQPVGSSTTRFTLLHSSRTPGELPPAEILQPLISRAQMEPDKLKLHLFVDSSDKTTAPPVPLNNLQVSRIGEAAIRRALETDNNISWWRKLFRLSPTTTEEAQTRKVLFLVCGPDPMVSAIAGPFGRNLSQGPVGGVLGALGCRSSQVWKLS